MRQVCQEFFLKIFEIAIGSVLRGEAGARLPKGLHVITGFDTYCVPCLGRRIFRGKCRVLGVDSFAF